jgi:hypothetical protein
VADSSYPVKPPSAPLALRADQVDNTIVAKGKIIRWVVVAVVVLIAAAALAVNFALDSIVRSRIEANATESLKLKTTLSGAKLSLLHGTLGLTNLQVESPDKFGAESLLSLSSASAGVSYGELRGDPIKIDQITISDPSLVVEFSTRVMKLNLQVLAENLKQNPSQPASEPVHVVIKNLRIENPQIVIWPGVPGLTRTEDLAVPLGSIELHDIGSGPGAQNGAAIKDVAMQVITAITAKAADSDKVPEPVRRVLALQARDLGQLLGAEFDKQMQGISKTVQQKIQEKVGNELGKDAGKAVEGGLKDLAGSLQKSQKPATQPAGGGP